MVPSHIRGATRSRDGQPDSSLKGKNVMVLWEASQEQVVGTCVLLTAPILAQKVVSGSTAVG